MKRYENCQREDGNCEVCSLPSHGKDCRNNPINQLAHLRAQCGMSQGDLAKASGVHAQMISKIERGERAMENTTLKTALALADALGVDVRELLQQDTKMPPE